jgi:hypothetical protein
MVGLLKAGAQLGPLGRLAAAVPPPAAALGWAWAEVPSPALAA